MDITQETIIIALDGHDGAGKTTLAHMLAEHLEGQYVKPYSDSLGDMIAWLYRRNNMELADLLSRTAVEKVIDDNPSPKVLVFDRHWLSMFTVLPQKYHDQWRPLPPTILCWANLETTYRRLIERGESIEKREKHEYFCSLYKELAVTNQIPIVDTSFQSIDKSLDQILKYLDASGVLRGVNI